MRGLRRVSTTILGLLLAACFLFCLPAAQAQAVSSLPQPTDYVSDFAHVLSPDTVARLDSVCSQLDHSKANAQLAIVTVADLNGEDAADYADELETRWKMGRKGSDRGALVLLAVNDHKYRIEVGYGLEGILNDAKVGDMGRAMVPYLRAGDYNSAVSLAVGQIAQVIATDASVTLENQPVAPPHQVEHHGGALAKVILLVVLLCFFGGFSLLRMLLGFGLFFGGWGGGPWMGGGGGSGWGGGGGFGGGGGGSDSGFGGFGGGSFGGGGAGGSW